MQPPSLRATEQPPAADEAMLVDELIPLLERLIEKSFLTGTTYRDTHAKGHAAVRATFTVEPDLPQELKVGLFATQREYPAWVRFSNLDPTPRDDRRRDVRGLAIKLMDVDGEMLWQGEPGERTLDLVLMSSPTFLAPDLRSFCALERALYRGGLALFGFFATHPRMFLTIVRGQRRTANLLEIAFFSQTAYALGDVAVHYHLRPLRPASSALPRPATPNFLRDRLREDLGRDAAVWDFMVQLQRDPHGMPIENPMAAWNPRRSPYRKVATLRLPRQRFDSPAQMQFCEGLSFNPWRTLREHRPLGAINRARRRVYPAIATFRHGRNGVAVREPRPQDPCFADELNEKEVP
jgi:hypothetical protein